MPDQLPSRAGWPAQIQLLELVRPVTEPGAWFVR